MSALPPIADIRQCRWDGRIPRSKIRLARGPKARVNNRIDNKFPVIVPNADDWADLKRGWGLRKRRRLEAEFKIDAIEKIAAVRIRYNKQVTDLAPIGERLAGVGDRGGRIKANFPPIGDAVSEFRCAPADYGWRSVRQELRLGLSHPGIIQMLFDPGRCQP
jgi:hypothetical protein